jgi:chromosome segregation ATPase
LLFILTHCWAVASFSLSTLIPSTAAESTRRSEVAELHQIIAYLETQLRSHAAAVSAQRAEVSAAVAERDAQRSELVSIRTDRDRLREHVVQLQISSQELRDSLKQTESRLGVDAGAGNGGAAAPGVAEVDSRWYLELARVENLLAAERRVNAELLKENANYRRLVLVRERELLQETKKQEIVHESESTQLAVAEQRLSTALAKAAEFEEENRALLAVQRAKTRTIEKLSEQLTDATELLARTRVNDLELASLRERHERTAAALASAKADVERQNRQIEQLQARSTGVPFEQWLTERSLLRERVGALETRVARAEASASRSATTARNWAARWRRLAAGINAQVTSLSSLRTLVRKQRENMDAGEESGGGGGDDTDGSDSDAPEPFGSVAAARATMAVVLNKR